MEEDNKEQPLRQEEGKNEEDRSEPSKNISEDHESETTKKVVFSLCYIWGILFFLPLVLYRDDKKATFHANQGLVLLIVAVCGNVIFGILTSFGGVMRTIFGALAGVFSLALLILGIIGIVNVVNDETKELPVVGKIKILK